MIATRTSIGLVAKFLNISVILLVVPFIGINLGEEAVGLWLLFFSIGGITGLFEAGFYNSVLRFVSYLTAGKTDLPEEGLGFFVNKPIEDLHVLDNAKLNSLIVTISLIFLFIGITLFLILSTLGSLYINFLNVKTVSIPVIQGAWFFFILASCLHLAFSFLSAILHGIGKINQNNVCIIISKVVFIILSIFGLSQGEGLVFLSIIFLLHVLLMRSLNFIILIQYISLKASDLFQIKNFSKSIFLSLRKNSLKMVIVNIGSYVLSRGSIIIANGAIPVILATKYTLTITSFTVLAMIATEPLNLMYDRICTLQASNSKPKIKKLVFSLYLYGLLIFLFGVFSIFIFQQYSTPLGLNFNFLDKNLLTLVCFIYFFEYTTGFSNVYLTSKNYIPFMKATLISGFLVLICNFLFVHQYEIIGLILIYAIIQSCYNFWKWPYEMITDFMKSDSEKQQ